jgi:hypothetical protein
MSPALHARTSTRIHDRIKSRVLETKRDQIRPSNELEQYDWTELLKQRLTHVQGLFLCLGSAISRRRQRSRSSSSPCRTERTYGSLILSRSARVLIDSGTCTAWLVEAERRWREEEWKTALVSLGVGLVHGSSARLRCPSHSTPDSQQAEIVLGALRGLGPCCGVLLLRCTSVLRPSLLACLC